VDVTIGNLRHPDEEPSLIDNLVDLPLSDAQENTAIPNFTIVAGGSKRGKDLLVEQPGYSYNIMRR
jgi:hypothetical protein